VDLTRAEALLAGMNESAAKRQTLRGMASFSFDGAVGNVRSRQAIVLETPSHLRIEVLGFLSQAVAVLVTDGEQFDLFRAENRSRRNGAVYPGLLFEVAQIDLTPEEGVALLLGAPPEQDGLLLASATGLEGGGVRIERVDDGGVLRQRLDFDAEGRLVRVETYAPGERLLWSAAYGDFRQVGDIDFAHEISLWFPSSQTQVQLVFKQVELNPTLPEGVFTLQLPSARWCPVRTGAAA
jgi:hypothetical protein